MFYNKFVDDEGYIVSICSTPFPGDFDISFEEYDLIMGIIQNKPEDTDEVWYRLNDSTLEYEPFDWPEEEEIQEID